jgi:iron complex outermembrane receptor protein
MSNRIPALARAARLHILLPALAGSLFAYSAANAQSTGSQVQQGEIIVTGARQQSTGGLAVVTKVAKDQSIVTSQFIATQVGSANFGQNINLLPGISYTSDDPTGILSGDLRVHGFPGDHVSVTLDGTPLNDTGNYAIFPGEYATQEIVDHMTVNLGSTEVDSPTASAIGGTINIVTKIPKADFGAAASVEAGSFNARRYYAELDTGAVGPTGLKSYLTANWADSNKFKGSGTIQRAGVDGRFYQPLNGADFVSVAYTYAQDRADFYQSSSLSQIATFGRSIDYNTQWSPPTFTNGPDDGSKFPAPSGAAQAPGFEQGNGSNYYKLHPNPVDFGDLRAQSRFDLSHGFTFTADPYFFYTLANGGGATLIAENDKRLIGSAPVNACGGVDLSGDGDCKDKVYVYSPSNTQTHRYGLNSSLIWDLDTHNRFQLAYTYDDGHHRQSGEYSHINQLTGDPDNVFGGKQGYGTPITTLDGSILRKRDRYSEAVLNQIAVNYVGKFMDDKLHVNIGLRDPMFQRHLNEFCYEFNGGSAYCDSVSPALVVTAMNGDNAGPLGTPGCTLTTAGQTACRLTALLGTTVKYGVSNKANFRLPFHQTYKFTKVLPNVGASYGVGYRFHTSTLTASANAWYSTWNNHIVQSFDPLDPTLTIDRNVGGVQLYGLDLEAGWRPTENLTVYASGTLMKSALQANYIVSIPVAGVPTSVPLPVKGKELVLTPDQAFSLRGEYRFGDFTIGAQAKYTGRRFVDDINSTSLSGYVTADFDAEYHFTIDKVKSTLQLNVYNLMGVNYFNRSNTASNFTAVAVPGGTFGAQSGPFVSPGAPATAYVTLKAAF